MTRVCPERPELLDGVPMGQYHCGGCLCMVVAGIAHPAHDDGCRLEEYSQEDFDAIVAAYDTAYAPLLDPSRPPNDKLPPELAWVWMGGAHTPHWGILAEAREEYEGSCEGLARLAELQQPLVRLRGQWVELDPRRLKRGLELLDERPGVALTLAEVLGLAATLDEETTGLPVIGVEGDGWIRGMGLTEF